MGQNSQPIEESIRLIEGLEQFSSLLQNSDISSEEIAWGAYSQTLTEIKRKLLLVLDEGFDESERSVEELYASNGKAAVEPYAPMKNGDTNHSELDFNNGKSFDDTASIGSGSIARRIKKLPPIRQGKVRELIVGDEERSETKKFNQVKSDRVSEE